MRRQFCHAIIGLLLAAPEALAADDIYSARGFSVGHCYEQLAVRRCQHRPLRCDLEVFPNRASRIDFTVKNKVKIPPNAEKTTDYGIFKFQVVRSGKKTEALLLGVTRISLEEFNRDTPVNVKSVDCQ